MSTGKKEKIVLSEEQNIFIEKALEGKNIIVDACIGSGKTTAIQMLCNRFPKSKKILYLTYNKLLKLDAKERIKNKNVHVTNYHGFAFWMLKKRGITVGITELIQTFNNHVKEIQGYDVLIIDEYQDIELELSIMLEKIKASNPNMQIVAVGDMEQKIYDKTTLDVREFIESFLGDYIELDFTVCFRLSKDIAERLGRIWQKRIVGVNESCTVEEMTSDEVISFLADESTDDILCLGSRTGEMTNVLNELEKKYPEKFNKRSVYASIRDEDSHFTNPEKTSAIFTTYDSSKGLERKICVVFDFTEGYWENRSTQPNTSYTIIRNIFCVAASRGKEHIIFVKPYEGEMLSEKSLMTKPDEHDARSFDVSDMFDFKYREDVEDCYKMLTIKKIKQKDASVIEIPRNDELIDLSPCIGIYQEAVFFKNYDIDVAIKRALLDIGHPEWFTSKIKKYGLDKKILYLTSLETTQRRYRSQVDTPFVSKECKKMIIDRLATQFSREESAQVEFRVSISDSKMQQQDFVIDGVADVVRDDTVYELKFVSELDHVHCLQCACYMAFMKKKNGIVWNTRDNSMISIALPMNKRANFIKQVVKTITKGNFKEYNNVVVSEANYSDTKLADKIHDIIAKRSAAEEK